ncbi:hypothetical protein PAPYR_3409 [Paratrimastix pyriformis]|uniref:Fungal lipase-type domain-containing protein n=1 Tax=Paratrimastix pyriformis TaxID=342808 RepID=A0ABQ8UPJ0_9EUKA|nr:hypothetical protein PAPYR_3409 [Paratrimastix pyriformis]
MVELFELALWIAPPPAGLLAAAPQAALPVGGSAEWRQRELQQQLLYTIGNTIEHTCPPFFFTFTGAGGCVSLLPVESFPPPKVGYSMACWIRVLPLAAHSAVIFSCPGEGLLTLDLFLEPSRADPRRACLMVRAQTALAPLLTPTRPAGRGADGGGPPEGDEYRELERLHYARGREVAPSATTVLPITAEFSEFGGFHHVALAHSRAEFTVYVDGRVVARLPPPALPKSVSREHPLVVTVGGPAHGIATAAARLSDPPAAPGGPLPAGAQGHCFSGIVGPVCLWEGPVGDEAPLALYRQGILTRPCGPDLVAPAQPRHGPPLLCLVDPALFLEGAPGPCAELSSPGPAGQGPLVPIALGGSAGAGAAPPCRTRMRLSDCGAEQPRPGSGVHVYQCSPLLANVRGPEEEEQQQRQVPAPAPAPAVEAGAQPSAPAPLIVPPRPRAGPSGMQLCVRLLAGRGPAVQVAALRILSNLIAGCPVNRRHFEGPLAGWPLLGYALTLEAHPPDGAALRARLDAAYGPQGAGANVVRDVRLGPEAPGPSSEAFLVLLEMITEPVLLPSALPPPARPFAPTAQPTGPLLGPAAATPAPEGAPLARTLSTSPPRDGARTPSPEPADRAAPPAAAAPSELSPTRRAQRHIVAPEGLQVTLDLLATGLFADRAALKQLWDWIVAESRANPPTALAILDLLSTWDDGHLVLLEEHRGGALLEQAPGLRAQAEALEAAGGCGGPAAGASAGAEGDRLAGPEGVRYPLAPIFALLGADLEALRVHGLGLLDRWLRTTAKGQRAAFMRGRRLETLHRLLLGRPGTGLQTCIALFDLATRGLDISPLSKTATSAQLPTLAFPPSGPAPAAPRQTQGPADGGVELVMGPVLRTVLWHGGLPGPRPAGEGIATRWVQQLALLTAECLYLEMLRTPKTGRLAVLRQLPGGSALAGLLQHGLVALLGERPVLAPEQAAVLLRNLATLGDMAADGSGTILPDVTALLVQTLNRLVAHNGAEVRAKLKGAGLLALRDELLLNLIRDPTLALSTRTAAFGALSFEGVAGHPRARDGAALLHLLRHLLLTGRADGPTQPALPPPRMPTPSPSPPPAPSPAPPPYLFPPPVPSPIPPPVPTPLPPRSVARPSAGVVQVLGAFLALPEHRRALAKILGVFLPAPHPQASATPLAPVTAPPPPPGGPSVLVTPSVPVPPPATLAAEGLLNSSDPGARLLCAALQMPLGPGRSSEVDGFMLLPPPAPSVQIAPGPLPPAEEGLVLWLWGGAPEEAARRREALRERVERLLEPFDAEARRQIEANQARRQKGFTPFSPEPPSDGTARAECAWVEAFVDACQADQRRRLDLLRQEAEARLIQGRESWERILEVTNGACPPAATVPTPPTAPPQQNLEFHIWSPVTCYRSMGDWVDNSYQSAMPIHHPQAVRFSNLEPIKLSPGIRFESVNFPVTPSTTESELDSEETTTPCLFHWKTTVLWAARLARVYLGYLLIVSTFFTIMLGLEFVLSVFYSSVDVSINFEQSSPNITAPLRTGFVRNEPIAPSDMKGSFIAMALILFFVSYIASLIIMMHINLIRFLFKPLHDNWRLRIVLTVFLVFPIAHVVLGCFSLRLLQFSLLAAVGVVLVGVVLTFLWFNCKQLCKLRPLVAACCCPRRAGGKVPGVTKVLDLLGFHPRYRLKLCLVFMVVLLFGLVLFTSLDMSRLAMLFGILGCLFGISGFLTLAAKGPLHLFGVVCCYCCHNPERFTPAVEEENPLAPGPAEAAALMADPTDPALLFPSPSPTPLPGYLPPVEKTPLLRPRAPPSMRPLQLFYLVCQVGFLLALDTLAVSLSFLTSWKMGVSATVCVALSLGLFFDLTHPLLPYLKTDPPLTPVTPAARRERKYETFGPHPAEGSVCLLVMLMLFFGLMGVIVFALGLALPTVGSEDDYLVIGDKPLPPPAPGAPLPYAGCMSRWGGAKDPLGLVDLALMSSICYGDPFLEEHMMQEAFAAHGSTYQIAYHFCADKQACFTDFYSPVDNASVIAIRSLNSRIVQGVSFITDFFTVQFRYYEAVEGYVRATAPLRSKLVLTGHSLGGGIAKILAASTGTAAVAFSGPGIGDLVDKLDLPPTAVERNLFTVVPDGDLVPRIGEPTGTMQNIHCYGDASPFSCHSILRTICELSIACGDPYRRGTTTCPEVAQ